MALVVKDRVRETTTTTGTGTITLAGAVLGFQSFVAIGNANTTYYAIVDPVAGSWEVGIGTYTSAGTLLSRDTVLESSAGGAKVSFVSGTKDVFVTYPADRSVSQADVGTDPNEIPLNQYLGSMAYQDRLTVNIGGGVATLGTATVTTIQNDTAISNVEPSLMLNFAAVEALDPRITYTRASTATYYNGVTTAVAEQNLLLYSQEFDNAYWTKDNVILTANAIVAPDGTTTAENIVANTTLTFHRAFRSFTLSAGEYTFSVYVKSNGLQWVGLRTNSVRSFDIINGVVGAGSINATISNAGNGWFRCTITETTANPVVAIQLSDVDTSTTNPVFAGDDISGVYLWGAQLEQRSAVTAYTPTTTQPITNYIPVLLTAASGVARFDHNPISGDSLGFLVEQQSTNLVLQSQTFDSATWVKNGGGTAVTVIPNTIIAPDGTLTGDKLDEAGGVTQSQVILQGITVANSTAHTFSFYAKAAERSFVYTQVQGAGNFQVVFNLTTGTVGVSSGTFTAATITPVGNNWYRCAVTATSTTTNFNWYIEPQSTNALGTHLGVANNGIFLWGAQVEALAIPTSYIVTVASQVTRAADAASMTGTNFSSWYSQGQGTLYVESLAQNTAASNHKNLRLSDGTTSNEIWLGNGSPGTSARSQIVLGGVDYFSGSVANQVTAGQFGKYAVSFETNNAALCANGTLSTVDTTVAIASSINQFAIIPPSQRAGYYKKIVYYPRRLSNEELQEMTS